MDCIGHQQEIHGCSVLHFNLENAINTSNQGGGVFLDVIKVDIQILHHDIYFFLEHGFDNKFAIMRKEEEAARLSLRFACFKHCLVVVAGR